MQLPLGVIEVCLRSLPGQELNSMTATLQTLRDEGAESAVGSDSNTAELRDSSGFKTSNRE